MRHPLRFLAKAITSKLGNPGLAGDDEAMDMLAEMIQHEAGGGGILAIFKWVLAHPEEIKAFIALIIEILALIPK